MKATLPVAGKVKRITSTANPVIKDIRALARKRNRDQQQMFVAEGFKLVADALDGNWPVRQVLFGDNMARDQRVQALGARARARGADILEVNERVLAAVSRRDNPQMVIGVIGQRFRDPFDRTGSDAPLWIAVDRIRDPGNLGTIVRTADAVGCDRVMLIGESTDPFSPEAVRATMGSIFHVGLSQLATVDFARWRKDWPGSVVGTHLQGSADYREADYGTLPVLLVMGNEQQGMSSLLAAQCDVLCHIPMVGRADSLNLAVATGIMAFEIRRHALPASETG